MKLIVVLVYQGCRVSWSRNSRTRRHERRRIRVVLRWHCCSILWLEEIAWVEMRQCTVLEIVDTFLYKHACISCDLSLHEERADLRRPWRAGRAMYSQNDSPGSRFERRKENMRERGGGRKWERERKRTKENISYYFVLWSNESVRATVVVGSLKVCECNLYIVL